MATLTRLMTAEELEQLDSDMRLELVDGVLIEMPPANAWHSRVAGKLATKLGLHADSLELGWVLVECGFVLKRNPDTVRAPDVAFVRRERIPAGGPAETFWEIAPDLAIEIVSPSNTPGEVQAKIREWIGAGVPLVWVCYPRTRTVSVIRSLLDREELTDQDVLDGGAVLPGFSCPVADVFA